jgi:galactokinase
MWRLATNLREPLPDLARLLQQLSKQADFFATERPLFLARAPGRLDLMGGIADYSGSLVLELPLACATYALVQPDVARALRVRTLNADGGVAPEVALPLDELLPAAGALDYASAGALLATERRRAWAAYVLGTLVVLQRERGWWPPAGLRLLISSEVPIGRGVSSSAALEVAAMHAICGAWGWDLSPRDLALLCQKVENRIVGAPCGVMDQMTCACGQKDRLLALRCQPAELEAPVTLPADVEVFGIDSGIRHAVSGADYTSVRVVDPIWHG